MAEQATTTTLDDDEDVWSSEQPDFFTNDDPFNVEFNPDSPLVGFDEQPDQEEAFAAAGSFDVGFLQQSGGFDEEQEIQHIEFVNLATAAREVRNAATQNDLKKIESVVRSAGPEIIDHPDCNGKTAWHLAAECGHVDAIELLVRLGSKAIDTPDNNGWTPIHAAASNGHPSAIEALVRLGSKAIDTPTNNSGWTPMFAAAQNGHEEVIEALVRLGSNAIDTPDNYGCTPLHAAALNGHVSAIEALVRLGSNAIDTPDKDGIVPIKRATRNRVCVRLLKALGATIPSWFERVTEEEVADIRYRVYFAQPLAHRLLDIPMP